MSSRPDPIINKKHNYKRGGGLGQKYPNNYLRGRQDLGADSPNWRARSNESNQSTFSGGIQYAQFLKDGWNDYIIEKSHGGIEVIGHEQDAPANEEKSKADTWVDLIKSATHQNC